MTRQPLKSDVALSLAASTASSSEAKPPPLLRSGSCPSSPRVSLLPNTTDLAASFDSSESPRHRKAGTVVKGRFKITSLHSPDHSLPQQSLSSPPSIVVDPAEVVALEMQKPAAATRPPMASVGAQQGPLPTTSPSPSARPKQKRMPQTLSQQKGRFEISDVANDGAEPLGFSMRTGGSPMKTAVSKQPLSQDGAGSAEVVSSARRTVQSGRFTISDVSGVSTDLSSPSSSESGVSAPAAGDGGVLATSSGRFEVTDLGRSRPLVAENIGGMMEALALADPLSLMVTLQKQVQALVQENEDLKRDNESLLLENARLLRLAVQVSPVATSAEATALPSSPHKASAT